jgi:hypothetical protein
MNAAARVGGDDVVAGRGGLIRGGRGRGGRGGSNVAPRWSPYPLFALLLSRSALTCVEDARLTLWVEALDGAEDRLRQAALVAAFNQLTLRCRGREVVVHIRERAAQIAA